MNEWYQVKCKFTKEFTDGTLKRVTEPCLYSAMSFTEAEERAYKEIGEYVRGEFLITHIAKQKIQDIFDYEDSDVWYKAKVSYVSEDADSGKEKKVNNSYLVNAQNTNEASDRIKDSLRGLMVSYEISKVEKTDIVEIYPYDPEAFESEEEDVQSIEASSNINVAYSSEEE